MPQYAAYPACPFLRPWDSCPFDTLGLASRRFAPSSCALGELDASALHNRLARRMLLFVGDSIQVQHFSSFACMVHAQEPSRVNRSTLQWKSPKSLNKRCDGQKLCHYEHGCIFFNSGLRLCMCAIVALDQKLYHRCLRTHQPRQHDIVYYGSIGIHYTGEMGSKVDPLNVRQLAVFETALVFSTFGYTREGTRRPGSPRVLWREVTAQHFEHPGGHYKQILAEDDYNRKTATAQPCSANHTLEEMVRYQRWNQHTNPIIAAANITIIRVWRMTAMEWDAHVTFGDCTHWCLPGLPDSWGHILAQVLGVAKRFQRLHEPLRSRSPQYRSGLARTGPFASAPPENITVELPTRVPKCETEGAQSPSGPATASHKLIVGVHATIVSRQDLHAVHQSLCSIRGQHPEAFVHVVSHAGAYHAELRSAVQQEARASLQACHRVLWSFEALGAAARYAAQHYATHFAFLGHGMHLLSPLPSMTLPCPLTAFEVLLTEQKMNLKISDPVVPWLDARIRHFGLQLNRSEVASVPSHGFICDRESLLRLLQLEFFAISVSDEHQNEGTARLLGILAAHRLKSPPFRCNLDGCALQGTAKDVTECHAQRFLRHLEETHVMGSLPSVPSPPPVSGALARCHAPAPETPLFRVVAPSSTIAQTVFGGLTPTGTALFGDEALQQLSSMPVALSNVLIYVHSFKITSFENIHARMLKVPSTQHLPLVAQASILLACNNRHVPTTHLLQRLRSYTQRYRWLFHTPTNPGRRTERKPGYLCGEMATLAESSPVWSRYRWVFYSNPDVIVTPEFFVNMSARLVDDESQSQKPVALYADHFPTASRWGRTTRYAMEYLVLRTRSMVLHSGTARNRSRRASSVFERAAAECLTSPRGIFPEVALRKIQLQHALKVQPLRAVNYLRSRQAEVADLLGQNVLARLAPPNWDVGVTKTALVAGGVWHNENLELADAYLRGLEANTSRETP